MLTPGPGGHSNTHPRRGEVLAAVDPFITLDLPDPRGSA
jgi:hypothetical protein